MMGKHEEFGAKHADAIVGGNALDTTSDRDLGRSGTTVTDGPFAETKEALGGYYLVEAADLDEAIAIAKRRPGAVRWRRGPPDHGVRAERRAERAVAAAVADAHRREWGFVLAATVRVTRDLDLAEECVQDAYARALTTWAQRRHPGQARRLAHDRRRAAARST